MSADTGTALPPPAGFAFGRELLLALTRVGRRPRLFGWREVLEQFDQTGPRALPIVVLACALVGLMLGYMGGAQLARIGGEEFLLVLTDTGHDGALRVLSELRAIFGNLTLPHLPAGVAIGFSTGIAEAHASDTADTLWQRADQGVYRAKAGGRGHDVFVPHA